MRPIAVQPVMCHIISSAFARRTSAREWLQTIVPDFTHGAVAGRDVATALLPLQETFDDYGIIISLDQAKCFDHVIPELALGHLKHAGMHPQWIKHFTWTWSHTKSGGCSLEEPRTKRCRHQSLKDVPSHLLP